MGGKKRCRRMREKVHDEPDVVFLGEKVSEAEKVEHVSGAEATASASGAGGAPSSSSSSSKSKGTKSSSGGGGGLKGKREADNDDVVCLGESIDERESFVVPPPREVIEIVDSDDDGDDDSDNDDAPKEGKKRSENEEFEDAASVEQVRGTHYVSSDKAAESFGDGECGWRPEDPIRIDFVEGNENEEGSEDDESGFEVYSSPSSDTSDYDESSDEDFQADAREGSSSEDDSSSYDDEDEKEEKERIRNSTKQKERSEPWAKNISRFDEGTSSSMDQGRNVLTGSSAVCKKNDESPASLKKKDK